MAHSGRVISVGSYDRSPHVVRVLRAAGFDVTTARDATDADLRDADCVLATPQHTPDAVSATDTPVLAALTADVDPTALLDSGAHDVVHVADPTSDTLLVKRIENAIALHASERRASTEHDRFETLFGQFPEPTVAYRIEDGEPVVTDANAAFDDTFTDADADIVGRPVDDLVVGPGRDVEATVLNERVERGETIDRKVTRNTPNGDRVFWLRNISLDTTPPTGFAVYTDVTDHLRERERAQTYLEHSRDIVAITDADTTYTYVSPAVEHTFGYHPSDLVGKRALDLMHPTDRERVRDTLQSVSGDEPTTIEFRSQNATGDWRWVESVVTDQRDDPLIDGYLVNARDITERKARDRDRRRQARIIATLHDVAVDIETATTPGEVYQSLVDAAEDVLDYQLCIVDERDGDKLVPAAVPTGTPDDYYFDEVAIDAENNLAARVARTHETIVVDDLADVGVDAADSSYRSAITVPLSDYGIFQAVADEPNGFDDADREFTEILASHAVATLDRLARERELERQTNRLEKFASVVSHDLRTPLQVAVGAIELSRETGDLDQLDTASGALQRIDRLASDLLAWARGATLVDHTEPVNIAALATTCWAELDTPHATLDVEEAVVDADPDRLRQLLTNLLRNSVEHGVTDPENDTVTVTVAPIDDGTGFYVQDDGPGIPADERPDIFDAGHTTSATGSGFGLDIARDIAIAHGWTLTLDDDYTDGARFVVDCTASR